MLHTTVSNLNARDVALYSLNVTTQNTIPKLGNEGAMWLEFAEDYPIEASMINCQSSGFWAGGYPDCRQTIDKVKLSGATGDYVGNLNLHVNELPNPLNEL